MFHKRKESVRDKDLIMSISQVDLPHHSMYYYSNLTKNPLIIKEILLILRTHINLMIHTI